LKDLQAKRHSVEDQNTIGHGFSVVICTYTEKRWEQVQAAINSACAQSMPAKEVIVVVDHNPSLYARLSVALSGVRVVESSGAPGLSGAKNTGVALARGDIVAFLDDDAIAESDWLRFFSDSFADPHVIGVGGLVLPRWETQRPRWFPAEYDWVVGCNHLRMPPFRAQVRNLMGGNMSLRREAFDLAGEFRNGIGRTVGKRPLGCEDTEFCIRLSHQAPTTLLLFESRAVIRHLVPAARCRFSYFTSRCFGEGLSKAVVVSIVGSRDGLSAERDYTTRILPRGIARNITDLLHGDLWGLARAGTIVTGLAVTVAGYLVGSLRKSEFETPGPTGVTGRAGRISQRADWRKPSRPRALVSSLMGTRMASADHPTLSQPEPDDRS
jgi:glucosyl-dolichyl phosphate glucuronosyltransferase